MGGLDWGARAGARVVATVRASRGGRRARARASTDSVRVRFVSKLIGWRVYNISRYDALLFNWAVQNRREPASREGGSFAAGAAAVAAAAAAALAATA